MSKMKERLKKAKRYSAHNILWSPFCSNCGFKGRHFVPPSMGEIGFFACEMYQEAHQ